MKIGKTRIMKEMADRQGKSVKEEKISPRDRLSQFISMPSLRNPIIEFTLFSCKRQGMIFFDTMSPNVFLFLLETGFLCLEGLAVWGWGKMKEGFVLNF